MNANHEYFEDGNGINGYKCWRGCINYPMNAGGFGGGDSGETSEASGGAALIEKAEGLGATWYWGHKGVVLEATVEDVPCKIEQVGPDGVDVMHRGHRAAHPRHGRRRPGRRRQLPPLQGPRGRALLRRLRRQQRHVPRAAAGPARPLRRPRPRYLDHAHPGLRPRRKRHQDGHVGRRLHGPADAHPHQPRGGLHQRQVLGEHPDPPGHLPLRPVARPRPRALLRRVVHGLLQPHRPDGAQQAGPLLRVLRQQAGDAHEPLGPRALLRLQLRRRPDPEAGPLARARRAGRGDRGAVGRDHLVHRHPLPLRGQHARGALLVHGPRRGGGRQGQGPESTATTSSPPPARTRTSAATRASCCPSTSPRSTASSRCRRSRPWAPSR